MSSFEINEVLICIPDLVYVDGCDPSRVSLQGEETTRVLQAINLKQAQDEFTLSVLTVLKNNLSSPSCLPGRCGPGCRWRPSRRLLAALWWASGGRTALNVSADSWSHPHCCNTERGARCPAQDHLQDDNMCFNVETHSIPFSPYFSNGFIRTFHPSRWSLLPSLKHF